MADGQRRVRQDLAEHHYEKEPPPDHKDWEEVEGKFRNIFHRSRAPGTDGCVYQPVALTGSYRRMRRTLQQFNHLALLQPFESGGICAIFSS